MKTWWNFTPLFLLAILLPCIGFLPNFVLKGEIYGGGVIRQHFINKIGVLLPPDKANELTSRFMNADLGTEMMMYTPIAINIMLILFIFIYLFGLTFMNTMNFITKDKQKRQRQSAKN